MAFYLQEIKILKNYFFFKFVRQDDSKKSQLQLQQQ